MKLSFLKKQSDPNTGWRSGTILRSQNTPASSRKPNDGACLILHQALKNGNFFIFFRKQCKMWMGQRINYSNWFIIVWFMIGTKRRHYGRRKPWRTAQCRAVGILDREGGSMPEGDEGLQNLHDHNNCCCGRCDVGDLRFHVPHWFSHPPVRRRRCIPERNSPLSPVCRLRYDSSPACSHGTFRVFMRKEVGKTPAWKIVWGEITDDVLMFRRRIPAMTLSVIRGKGFPGGA